MTLQPIESTHSLDSQLRFAEALAHASLLPEAYRRQPANVLLAMQMGQALGLPFAEAITSINVIKGKPSMSADLMASLIRRAGHKLRIETNQNPLSVTATLIRRDDPEFPFVVTWDEAKARQAKLWGKGDGWNNYPDQMLRSRAITEVARQGASDVLHGVIYDPEELGGVEPGRAATITQIDQPAVESKPARLADIVAAEEAANTDWLGLAEMVAEREELKQLWRDAKAAGAPQDVLDDITAIGLKMAEASEVVEAEIIDGPLIGGAA